MTEVRSKFLQYRTHLSREQAQVVQQYLHRTTLFWNFLLTQLKPHVDAYMAEEASEASDHNFLFAAKEAYAQAVGNWVPTDTTGERWDHYLRLIRELPESVLMNRFDDLINAFALAKRDRVNKVEKPADLPRRKNWISSQSVRFDDKDLKVTADGVQINSVFPFSLEFPSNLPVIPSKKYQLSVTMRRIKSEAEAYGPMEHDDREYSITLKEAA